MANHESSAPMTIMGDYLRRHKLQNAVARAAWSSLTRAAALIAPDAAVEKFTDPAYTAGLIEGALVCGRLYYPDPDKDGALSYRRSRRDKWIAWDANRNKEFPGRPFAPSQLLRDGKINAVVPEAIRGNNPHERTPTDYVSLFDIDHVLATRVSTVGGLIVNGLIQVVTYESAYRRLGLYEQCGSALRDRDLESEPVGQVTSKGNGLILLL